MEEEQKLRVYGLWASPYSKKVELVLKLKGIPYDYVEEDITNKSQALIDYNPVHKKVPVLVHNGKPIAESHIIVEYIEETWPDHAPRLLPRDPYERSVVRFWASFLQNQLLESLLKVFKASGEARHKALQELHETLTTIEKEMGEYLPKGVTSFEGCDLGLLDVQLICALGVYRAQEEVFGVKILDVEKHPHICAWVAALIDLPVIKEFTPPHNKIVDLLHMIFQTQPTP